MELDWLNLGMCLFDGLSIKAGGKPWVYIESKVSLSRPDAQQRSFCRTL